MLWKQIAEEFKDYESMEIFISNDPFLSEATKCLSYLQFVNSPLDQLGYVHESLTYIRNYLAQYDIKLCRTSVRLINCNETNIGREESIMKLTGFNKVAAIEMSGTDYYFALYDDDIQAGDNVLVTNNVNLLKVKEVLTKEEAKEKYSKDITAEVKCKVDLSAYETRVENRKKAEKLRKEMDKKIAEMDEMNKYVLYAEKNPELAKMLEEYRELV